MTTAGILGALVFGAAVGFVVGFNHGIDRSTRPRRQVSWREAQRLELERRAAR